MATATAAATATAVRTATTSFPPAATATATAVRTATTSFPAAATATATAGAHEGASAAGGGGQKVAHAHGVGKEVMQSELLAAAEATGDTAYRDLAMYVKVSWQR